MIQLHVLLVETLDLLEQLPYVTPGNFASIGHSLGGHNSVFLGVSDPRVKAIVSSCGLDSFQDYMGGNIKGWTSTRYMPRLIEYQAAQIPFDFPELIGMMAPRWVYLSAPIGDTNFRWQSVQRIGQSAQEVFNWMGVGDRLKIVHPEAGHVFPPEIRLEAYQFMENALKHASAETGSNLK